MWRMVMKNEKPIFYDGHGSINTQTELLSCSRFNQTSILPPRSGISNRNVGNAGSTFFLSGRSTGVLEHFFVN